MALNKKYTNAVDFFTSTIPNSRQTSVYREVGPWTYGHTGHDYANGREGDSVYTPVGGTVYSLSDNNSDNGGMGNHVILQDKKGNYHRFMHFQQNAKAPVSRGQQVSAGQVIGKLGNTGMSTGAHLHYDIATQPSSPNPNKGQTFDPDIYLAEEFKSIPSENGQVVNPTPPTPTSGKKQVVFEPKSGPDYYTYPTPKVDLNAVGTAKLQPQSFGGLTYDVLETSGDSSGREFVKILTSSFGHRWVYTKRNGSFVVEGVSYREIAPPKPKVETITLNPDWNGSDGVGLVKTYESATTSSRMKGLLSPRAYGALTYEILEKKNSYEYVKIKASSASIGTAWIYTANDGKGYTIK